MVHALKEVWRVLAPGGILIDFRPVGDCWPLEFETGGQRQSVAILDRAPRVRDDVTCDGVMREVVRKGWFVHEKTQSLSFVAYWNSIAELDAPVTIPDEVSVKAQRLLDSSGSGSRIGITFDNTVSIYRKEAGSPHDSE